VALPSAGAEEKDFLELLDWCNGAVLIGEGSTLWRGKELALLFRKSGSGVQKIEMDLKDKTWGPPDSSSFGGMWGDSDLEEDRFDGYTIDVKVKRLKGKRMIEGHAVQGFQMRWKASRPPREVFSDPNQIPKCGTARLMEELTREIEIEVETWIDHSYGMPGFSWKRVAWGLPEQWVQSFVAVFVESDEVRKAMEKSSGLARETRIRYKMMDHVSEFVVKALEVRHSAIDAGEFDIPEGFREEN
jgi:hypothetical protein